MTMTRAWDQHDQGIETNPMSGPPPGTQSSSTSDLHLHLHLHRDPRDEEAQRVAGAEKGDRALADDPESGSIHRDLEAVGTARGGMASGRLVAPGFEIGSAGASVARRLESAGRRGSIEVCEGWVSASEASVHESISIPIPAGGAEPFYREHTRDVGVVWGEAAAGGGEGEGEGEGLSRVLTSILEWTCGVGADLVVCVSIVAVSPGNEEGTGGRKDAQGTEGGEHMDGSDSEHDSDSDSGDHAATVGSGRGRGRGRTRPALAVGDLLPCMAPGGCFVVGTRNAICGSPSSQALDADDLAFASGKGISLVFLSEESLMASGARCGQLAALGEAALELLGGPPESGIVMSPPMGLV